MSSDADLHTPANAPDPATGGARAKGVAAALLVVGALASAWFLRSDAAERIDWSNARHIEPLALSPFELPDQHSTSRSQRDFAGRVVVLDVASLQCAACRTTRNLVADLQQRLPESDVHFVTLFANRDDEPGALKSHQRAQRRVDPARWTLLAFSAAHTPRLLVELGLAHDVDEALRGLVVIEPRFFLLDGQGHVRGAYSAVQTRDIDWLVEDARALSAAQRPPTATDTSR